MSLVVRQVDHPVSGKVIHTYQATLEPDGSLNTTQIDFLKEGDIFMGYNKKHDSFSRLIHPSLPPVVPSSILESSVRIFSGTKALLLISLEDYLKAAEQQRTIFRQASAQSTQSLTPQVDKILSPPTIQYKPKDQEHAPRRIYMLPRRQSPGDTQSGPSSVVVLVRQHRDLNDPSSILHSWEIRLEYDFSLDTSKLTPNKPEDCYYVRGSDNEYHTLNINRKPSVSPSYLEYYLQDISGIALPVLQIMKDSDYWATDPKPRLELSHKSEYG